MLLATPVVILLNVIIHVHHLACVLSLLGTKLPFIFSSGICAFLVGVHMCANSGYFCKSMSMVFHMRSIVQLISIDVHVVC